MAPLAMVVSASPVPRGGMGRGLLLGVIAVVATTMIKIAFRDDIGGPTPFLLYFGAVLLAGWVGGWIAGLLVTLLGALVANFLFQVPYGELGFPDRKVTLQFFLFCLEGLVMTFVTAMIRRERQRALNRDAETRAALAQLDVVVQGVDDAITLQTRDHKLLFANEAAARFVGLQSAKALVELPLERLRELFVLLAADGSPFDWNRLPNRVLLAGGEPKDQLVRFKVLATGVERWAVVRAVGLRDAAGEITHVLNLFRDVSSQQREEQRRAFIATASEQLSNSLDYERTLSTIAKLAVPTVADWCAVDMMEEGQLVRLAVAHIDPQKVQLVADLQRRYPPDPNATRGVYNVLRTGVAEWMREIPEEVFTSRAQDDEHLRLIRSLQLRSYVAAPLKRGETTVGVISFVMAESGRLYAEADVELSRELAARASVAIENAQLFQELQVANRTKDSFMAMLGHELRNPLAPIRTALQLMELRDPEHHKREREIIERQLRHVVRLVDDLLDVTRITKGGVDLVRNPTSVSSVIESALELAAPLLEERKLQLAVNLAPELFVMGDATRLAQVISNLLNNAAKYCEPGGRIAIETRSTAQEAVITVSDDGMGISPDILPRVFELFVQAPQALDRSRGGLGVGLAIAKGLVESHGGSIWASSDGPGRGSLFTIRLSLTAERPAGRALPAPGVTVGPQRARVVLVDDNTDALDSLSEGLRELGYPVEVASDGPGALVVVERSRPKVALIDIGLPVMDGYEVARQLRQKPQLVGLKLIALTGYGQAGDRARSREAGFDAHLVKPVSLDQLESAIEKVISGPARPT